MQPQQPESPTLEQIETSTYKQDQLLIELSIETGINPVIVEKIFEADENEFIQQA